MARKRKASIETKVKRMFFASLPVVLGMGLTGLIIRYFGNKPVISDIAGGLNGSVKGTSTGLFGLGFLGL